MRKDGAGSESGCALAFRRLLKMLFILLVGLRVRAERPATGQEKLSLRATEDQLSRTRSGRRQLSTSVLISARVGELQG